MKRFDPVPDFHFLILVNYCKIVELRGGRARQKNGGAFRNAIKAPCANTLADVDPANLGVYANRVAYDAENAEPLDPTLPFDAQGTLVVEVPTRGVAVESTAIPSTSVLNEPEKFVKECALLSQNGLLTLCSVHEIPSIWKFMSSLGGCTSNGKFFLGDWKTSRWCRYLLMDGFESQSTDDNINVHAKKKSIHMGAPGMGKSTLLCVMAFYLVFQRKKNALVYRRLAKLEQENCLFYVGYEGDKVVHFAVQRCKAQNAINIYEELIRRQGISGVWVFLDGFRYQDISEGARTFKLLVTSQQVNLKSQERVDAYCCLLPCWAK